MGSEHYCLRWNNHQSNLLGVFSQLLQDESLVDVTLACSEGASIRAHKVVLSACSSYFQTLFLTHPGRHPIVILKDVRFAELRTLVDFMYKGEVNVEYCQLSELLKTAESLKVKGLAEMTNQNTTLAEPKREPDRLRPHSHSSAHATAAAAAAAAANTATAATSLTTASSPSSVPAATTASSAAAVSPHHHQHSQHHPSLGSPTSNAATVAAVAASLGITDLSTISKSRGLDPDGRSPSPTRLDPPSPAPLALYPPLRKNRDHTHSGSVSSSATTTITTAAAERSSEERDIADHKRPPSNNGNAFSSSSLNLNSLSSTVEGLSNANNAGTINESGNRRSAADDEDDDDDDDDDEDNEENGNLISHEPGTASSEQDQFLRQRSGVMDDDGRRSNSGANVNPNISTNNNNMSMNTSDDEYEPPIKIKSEVEYSPLSGLNMTINSPACLANSTSSGGGAGGGLVNSSTAGGLLGDLRPSSRDSGGGGGRGGGTPVACSSTTMAVNSGCVAVGGGNGSALGGLVVDRSSPRSLRDRSERSTFGSGGIPSPLSEPIAGPSGMGPVQQVPLSLKKEIDWDRGDDKSSGDSSLDFRHPHDSNLSHFFAGSTSARNYGRATGGIKSAPPAPTGIIGFPGAAVGAIPFVFPFAPLGLGLFDTDPKRILNLLHHQSALAEEALRYRNLLFGTPSPAPDRDSGPHGTPSPRTGAKPDDEQPSTSRRSAAESCSTSGGSGSTITTAPSPQPPPPSTSTSKGDTMIRVRDGLTKDGFHNGMELLLRNPLTPATVGDDQPQCCPADLSLYSSLLKGSSTATVDVDAHSAGASGSGSNTKCHICMANFPSVWLLEQHSALQHPHLTIHDDKPYMCGLCGQKSRYACCRYRTVLAKHREASSRSRVPADKLFTCDVCGMQFRYLKSFKKHRLNHALERLHGKKDKGGESEQVSSTNESDSVDLRGLIRDDENMSDNEEQDDTIDSMNVSAGADGPREFAVDEGQTKISSSMMERPGSEFDFKRYQSAHRMEAESSSSSSSIPSTSSSISQTLNSLINAESIPHHHLLGLNPQEQSILNFLRVDAAEKQRDRRFACPFCGKCVRSKENLKLHVRKHTGERPFVCLFCGRAFGGKSDLTRHLRIHTGERPYHCEACGKCFARADYLSKHLTTHVHNTSPR
ncbi:protein jim lovell isoform X1 [Sabethes cyaneus]|uniref:protein jim lovell isoform X1 n=1 Tax=Sabethes cyaneus TaxID=53552 RepID=UPI00237E26A8|nr:protein jim lovell isoform X1 [Sabethes cyaneus]XP_053682049.1 protein jim lovell isoform X1 [Sabethes cyaneus]XP_053682050.1 protein jim lovell isoform X1 [Sabethes cyaneus]XP_053682051.1 protein jim lovell isoform X1 [Sabethes cyaneus]